MATHGLGIDRILASTTTAWDNVGPDFKHRMTAPPEASETPQPGQRETNVVPFPTLERDGSGGLWPQLQALLHAENPALFPAWFATLNVRPKDGVGEWQGALTLVAPTRFHANFVATHHADRLAALARSIEPQITGVEVTVAR